METFNTDCASGRASTTQRRGAIVRSVLLVACILMVLTGGVLWQKQRIEAERKKLAGKRQSIADAYGSVNVFRGAPQIDREGKRLAYLKTSENGLGVFVCDLGTNDQHLIFEVPTVEYLAASYEIWPWSPDGNGFICVANYGADKSLVRKIIVCQPSASKKASVLEAGSIDVAGVAWLTPKSFVYVDKKENLHLVEGQADDSWKEVKPTRPNVGYSCLTALSTNQIAWLIGNRIWKMDLPSGKPHILFTCEKTNKITSFCYSPGSKQFLLSSSGVEPLWRVDSQYQLTSAFSQISNTSVMNAQWSEGDSGCVYFKSNSLAIVQAGRPPEPLKLPAGANVEKFTVSADGKKLVFLGLVGNAIAPCIWEYELSSAALRCLVPCTDRPSANAKRIDPVKGTLTLATGRKLNYQVWLPEDLDQHEKKHPLVIGETFFPANSRGMHGRIWLPALAACGSYVVVLLRDNWADDMSLWEADVMAVYQHLSKTYAFDTDRLFLFGTCGETPYLSGLINKTPELWKGAILFHHTVLPDLSALQTAKRVPKMLLSFGGEEKALVEQAKKYKEESVKLGVRVDVWAHPGEAHTLIGDASQRQRTKAIVSFVFAD